MSNIIFTTKNSCVMYMLLRGSLTHIRYTQLLMFTDFSNLFFNLIHIFSNIRAEAHSLKRTGSACALIILKIRKLIEKYKKSNTDICNCVRRPLNI